MQCGLEVDLFGRTNCGVIQTVPQTTNDSQHANFACRFENHFEKHLTFDSLGASLISVDGSGLERISAGTTFPAPARLREPEP